MSIVPLGVNRVTVPLQTHRAYNNLQHTMSALSRIEQQIMTQRQYQYGSDSPYNASTTLGVQSQVERKNQNAANLDATLTFLAASDSTLSKYDPLTDEARGAALNAINTATSAAERTALAQTVKQGIQQMFDFGNYSFRGRYVFAGATTGALPLEWGSDSYTVVYRGSETNLHSWSDADLLSQSNMNASEIFGAISDPVRGSVDLDPAINSHTLLSDLNGGQGVEKGSILFTYTIDDRVMTHEVDLSGCATLADVERAIEKMKTSDFSVSVDLTRTGLIFSAPNSQRGTLTVSEVGKGSVARQLGIPTNTGFDRDTPLVGKDVAPVLTTTTKLDNILGYKANATLRFAGANNDIIVQALHNGVEAIDPETGEPRWPLNDVRMTLQADWDMADKAEYAEYDPETQSVIVHIHPDNTDANGVMNAINSAAAAGTIPPFSATLSNTDTQRADLAGSGTIPLMPGTSMTAGTTSDGSGIDFDRTGIELVSGNATFNISFENCNTMGEVLAELNDPRYGLFATINETGTGIDIRSRISGADFCIGENGGVTAEQLGIRTTSENTRLDELDYGRGVQDDTSAGMHATARHTNVTPNSSLVLTAKNEGKQWNDYTVQFVPSADGKVVVSMNEAEKTVTIAINPGVTTACQVVDAFNAQPGPKQFFDLELDTTEGPNTGDGVVYDGTETTSGGTNGGIDFTVTRNDGTVLEIDIHGAETLGDVLRLINDHPDNADGLLTATLAKNGNGIELSDTSFGQYSGNTTVTRVDRTLLSTAAIDLGLVSKGEEYREKTTVGTQAAVTANADVLNGAILVTAKNVGSYANDVSVDFVEGTPPGFTWDAATKTMRFAIEPGVTTAADIVALFETQASETVRAVFDVQVGANADGQPGNGTGLVEVDSVTMQGGTDSALKGDDPNPQETESLFNALIRLQVAMEKNDTREIERATNLLDESVARMSEARASLGVMQNSLDNVSERLAEEYIQYESVLNSVLRIDYADASLAYMAQQLSQQAAMQVTSAMFQMTLLNYL